MSEAFDVPQLEKGIYQHYKGNQYQVLGVGRDTETNDYSVVYAPLYEHSGQPDIWIRPYSMFIESVDVDGATIPRFKKIEN